MRWPKSSSFAQRYWKALQEGDFDRAGMLVRAGHVKPHVRNAEKYTPLQWATKTGNEALFVWLLEQGARDTLQPAGKAFVGAFESLNPHMAALLLDQSRLPARIGSLRGKDNTSVVALAMNAGHEGVFGQVLSRLTRAELLDLLEEETRTRFSGLTMPLRSAWGGVMLESLLTHLDRWPDARVDAIREELIIQAASLHDRTLEAGLSHLPLIPLPVTVMPRLASALLRAPVSVFAAATKAVLTSGNVQEEARDVLVDLLIENNPMVLSLVARFLLEQGFAERESVRSALQVRFPGVVADVEKSLLESRLESGKPDCKKEVKRL